MKKISRRLLLVWCLVGSVSGLAASPPPLKLGVLPTLSPRTLFGNYQPLRAYLEQSLKRPVEMSTAVDFKAFHRATMAGDYDVVVTAPHLGRLAQIEAGFRPVATYAATNRALLIMAKDKPLHSAAEVRGKSVAVFDPHALVVLQGLHWLAERGLKPNVDFKVLETPSHNSVAHSVQSGESVLGITAPAGVRQWPEEFRERLAIYAELPEQQGVTWMAHPRLGAAYAKRVQAALLAFADSPASKPFFDATGYQGLRPVSEKDMRRLDPYAKEIASLLRERP